MGLLSMLRSLKKNDKEAKILVLGLDNSGKTTIMKRMSNEEIEDIMPTQGFNIKSIVQEDFKLNVWDIGGQKAIRNYWKNYYDDAGAVIYVIDSSDRQRMEETFVELSMLMDEEKLSGVPLLILANKQDLLNALSADEMGNEFDLVRIRDRAWSIQPCSAKLGEGLQEGIEWVIEQINERNSNFKSEATKARPVVGRKPASGEAGTNDVKSDESPKDDTAPAVEPIVVKTDEQPKDSPGDDTKEETSAKDTPSVDAGDENPDASNDHDSNECDGDAESSPSEETSAKASNQETAEDAEIPTVNAPEGAPEEEKPTEG